MQFAFATMRWIGLVSVACACLVSAEAFGDASTRPTGKHAETTVRFATFNIRQLNADKLGMTDDQGRGTNAQLRKAAEIIQRVRPDVLLVNEIDYDDNRRSTVLFRQRYLRIGQHGQSPIDYPHVFSAPTNTGVPTGMDLDHDGRSDGAGDAYGYGHYRGEYGMALLSRHPVDKRAARTFRHFAWKDMPGNLMPDGRDGKPAWYTPEQAAILRLSSKSHWDVPVCIGDMTIRVLASHPTPPVFDGPEDRNGRRNHDEIRFWADYIAGGERAAYIVDDDGGRGGLARDAMFVIMGDLNSDPVKMEAHAAYERPTIHLLLREPRVADPKPRSLGSAVVDDDYPGDKAARTSDFGRIDYVLPCRELTVGDAGVFWPPPGDPLHPLVSEPDPASDHCLVWVDVRLKS